MPTTLPSLSSQFFEPMEGRSGRRLVTLSRSRLATRLPRDGNSTTFSAPWEGPWAPSGTSLIAHAKISRGVAAHAASSLNWRLSRSHLLHHARDAVICDRWHLLLNQAQTTARQENHIKHLRMLKPTNWLPRRNSYAWTSLDLVTPVPWRLIIFSSRSLSSAASLNERARNATNGAHAPRTEL